MSEILCPDSKIFSSTYSPINLSALKSVFDSYHGAFPFDHCVIENFIEESIAEQLSAEFISYSSKEWFFYNNTLENKKALNDWNIFPKETYRFFSYLNSPEFVEVLSTLIDVKLFVDNGLHGGGWHCHSHAGKLNPHLDYSIHPKLGLKRKLNLIIYMSKEMQEANGGHLGFWSSSDNGLAPKILEKEIQPRFNRAVIFDTTQNSWHGISRALNLKKGLYRKSLAVYYLCIPDDNTDKRGRALFAPFLDQLNDKEVEKLIKMRADIDDSLKIYRS